MTWNDVHRVWALAVVTMMLGAASEAQALPGCGKVPPNTACTSWTCENSDGQWAWLSIPEPPGTECPAGVCDGNGTCSSNRTSVDQLPKFVVISIYYAPAGKRSSVAYGFGSSEGGRFQVTTTASLGLVVQTSAFGAGVSSTYSFGTMSSTVVGFSKLDSINEGWANAGTYDAPDHKRDLFRLWTNPKVTHASGGGLPDKLTWTTDGSTMKKIDLTAAQLLGEAPGPSFPPDESNFFLSLTPAEKLSILAMNPYFGTGSLSPARYQKVWAYQLHGPDNPGDMIPSGTYTVSYNTSRDSILGTSVDTTHQVLMGFDFLGSGGKAGVTYHVGYQESRATAAGEQKTASVTMSTPTVCFVMNVDVYIDAAFGTYLAVPTDSFSCATAPYATGTLTTTTGAPAANQAFVSNTSTGPRVIYTDANGHYKAY